MSSRAQARGGLPTLSLCFSDHEQHKSMRWHFKCILAKVVVDWLNHDTEQFEFYDVVVLFPDGRQDLRVSPLQGYTFVYLYMGDKQG